MTSIIPVVLSGGVGTRLWPLSRQESPKQLLPLASPRTMIQDTLARAIGRGFGAPIVICGEQHRFVIAEQILEAGIGGARIILEPKGRNTAPAAAVAAFAVERFVEKPDRVTAEGYLADGGFSWNSGIFLFAAKAFLTELERLEPKMLDHCRRALNDAHRDQDFIRLDAGAFKDCPAQSIDYAVMEHARQAAMVPVDMGWNDVGSWLSLWEIAAKSDAGNVVLGDVLLEGTRHCYVRSEGPLVAAIGVKDLVIVATPDAVLVSHKGAAQDVKKIVDALERGGRHHHLRHPQKP